MMQQYVRTNPDDEQVLDYDLLDVADRANFLRDVENWASLEECLTDLTDPDFTEAERNGYIESHAATMIDSLAGYGIEVDYIDPETRNMMQDAIEAKLAKMWLSETELLAVMTPAEIEKEFELAAGTVRQAIYHGRFTQYRRADDRTILIRRVDAEARWKK